jgi:hypothetical protein
MVERAADGEARRLGAVTGTADAAQELLEAVHLAPLARTELERASQLEPLAVRSLDAIHLEAAVRLRGAGRISAVLTFDKQLIGGCVHHGLPVEPPT